MKDWKNRSRKITRWIMSKGTKLYQHAKRVIPGGTQLLSKRPEQFLPGWWPGYYDRAKGCHVWDLDGRMYADVSYMGIGACVLGYAFDEVDNAVREAIGRGGMTTLNAPEEVYLADRLLSLHPWADMVRYARSGGEAMAQAVRIARAAAGRDKILFCGYHGWQDWYLAANLADEGSLDEHLLAGLEPAGVPRALRGTALPFRYNDIGEFRKRCAENEGELAAVVMEPIRNDWPEEGFLEEIRAYTEKNGIVLVFDEITAGFRLCCGGSHMTLHVTPDLAVFGKALGNGYPVTATIGVQSVMSAAQDTFMSSTFWTERTGFAAALATIGYYRDHDVQDSLIRTGQTVRRGWDRMAEKHGVRIEAGGIAPLSHFSFVTDKPLAAKTFFTQEMLKRGYLATTAFYSSYSHEGSVISRFLRDADEVFGQIANTKDLEAALEGPVCHSGFQRLN
jgi:glutamate-1-semialdehyde aminotransferase